MKYKINFVIGAFVLMFMFAAANISAQEKTLPDCKKGKDASDRIYGRVIDDEGKPVSGITVQIGTIRNPQDLSSLQFYLASTDADGCFESRQREEGFYTVSVNYHSYENEDYPFPTTFYPSGTTPEDAQILEVKKERLLEEIVLRLPPRMVKGVINLKLFWEDGTPAEDVTAKLENYPHWNYYAISGWRTGKNGAISMYVFADKGYQIKVSATRTIEGKTVEYYAESGIFDLGEKVIDFKLILKPKINLN